MEKNEYFRVHNDPKSWEKSINLNLQKYFQLTLLSPKIHSNPKLVPFKAYPNQAEMYLCTGMQLIHARKGLR